MSQLPYDICALPDVEELVDEVVRQLPCRAPGWYPEVKIEEEDKRTAKLLLDAFADGAAAEFTAIAQYFQHHLTIPDHAVANLELCIALVEMKHLELIGDVIEQLGGEPRYWATNKAYWSGGNVLYGDDPGGKVLMDIQAERDAISGYERLLLQIGQPQIQALLRTIVADERVHLELLERAYMRLVVAAGRIE